MYVNANTLSRAYQLYVRRLSICLNIEFICSAHENRMIQSERDVCLHTMNDYNIELFWFRALLFVFVLVYALLIVQWQTVRMHDTKIGK